MNVSKIWIATALAFGCFIPTLAVAQSTPTAQGEVIEGGRNLHVVVAQSEIKSDINASSISVATGGGLLGALIDAGVESARAKKAEVLIAPIRDHIADMKIDDLAIETAKASFADTEWFKANPTSSFSKDSSPVGKSALLDKATTAQTAFVEYVYDLSPEFDEVRVVMKYDVANKAIPTSAKGKGEKRLSVSNLVNSVTAISVVQLPSGGNKEANAARLAEDKGETLRKAIQLAFDGIKQITPKSVNVTADDLKAYNDKTKKKIVAGGFTGRPQPSAEGTTLLWDKTWRRLILIQRAK